MTDTVIRADSACHNPALPSFSRRGVVAALATTTACAVLLPSIAHGAVLVCLPTDAAAWMARYTELGGAATLAGNEVWLGWPMDGDPAMEGARVRHEAIIRSNDALRNEVRALILSGEAGQ